MKLTGTTDKKNICLTNKTFKGIDWNYGVENTINLMFLDNRVYPFNKFKKMVRESKNSKIDVGFNEHKIKVNRNYLSKFLNSYTNKTAKDIRVSVFSNRSPVLFEIGEHYLVLAPIINNEEYKNE